MGWVELRQRTATDSAGEKEWALTAAGLAMPPPASLQLQQVFTRVIRSADPGHTRGVADWFPLVALVVAAAAAAGAEQSGNREMLIAIRALSIAVLVLALARGLVGEIYLVKAAAAFPRLQQGGFYQPIKAFQSWPHLRWVAAFDLAILTAFALAVFLKGLLCLLALLVAGLVGIVILLRWRRRLGPVRRKRPAQPTTV